MANRQGNNGNSDRLLFSWSLKIPADGNYSHGIKRHLLIARKTMKNIDSILKSRDITLPTKTSIAKAMVFLIVMYACENLTIKEG